MENIGRAFTFVFEDKDWVQKVLIGAAFVLLSMFVIPLPFLLGYFLETTRNSSYSRAVPLPQWDNFGDKFVQGLIYLLVLILYAIPIMIAVFILMNIPCIGWIAAFLIYVMFLLALPYITVRFARTQKMADAFDLKGIVAFVQNNLVNLLIVAVMSIVFGIVGYLGFIALIIGVFFSMFWAYMGIAFLYGEVVRSAEQGAGVSVENIPPGGPASHQ